MHLIHDQQVWALADEYPKDEGLIEVGRSLTESITLVNEETNQR